MDIIIMEHSVVLLVDGHELTVTDDGQCITTISYQNKALSVSFYDTCGFDISSEKGCASLTPYARKVIQDYATTRNLEFL